MVLGHVAFTGSWKLDATAYTQQKGGQNAMLSKKKNVSGIFKVMVLGLVASEQKVEIHHEVRLGGNQWGTRAATRKG